MGGATMTMAYYLAGIGITVAGVGLQLLFQGEALKKVAKTNELGRWSSSCGIFWSILGLIAVIAGSYKIWGLYLVLPEVLIILALIGYFTYRKYHPRALKG